MSRRINDMIKERVCRELEEIAMKPEWSSTDVETLYYLTGSEKNVLKTNMMDEEGYSSGDWRAEGSYGDGYSGRHYVRGHYSRDGGNSYGRYPADSRQMFNSRMSGRMNDESYNMDERQMMQDAYGRMR